MQTTYCRYDAAGRRSSKTVGSTGTGYVYDGLNMVQELSGAAVNNSTPANIRASYLAGLGLDETIARYTPSTMEVMITDALGSTLALRDGSGASTLASYSYGPYGATSQTGASGNPMQYTGRENDGFGVYYYRNRYYSQGLSRFISEDKVGLYGGVNFYSYVNGDPISRVDPTGSFGLLGAGIGAVTGASAGYISGGVPGAIVGGVVGGLTGVVAPWLSAEVATFVGGGASGMFAATATAITIGAGAGAVSTIAGNALAGKCDLADGLAFGLALGAMAPLMSGEAFIIGAGGDIAVGSGMANGFSVATGVVSTVGAAMDPNAINGFK